MVAEYLGLPYSPPYLSIRTLGRLTGLNYASGSCGILPETGSILVRHHDLKSYWPLDCFVTKLSISRKNKRIINNKKERKMLISLAWFVGVYAGDMLEFG